MAASLQGARQIVSWVAPVYGTDKLVRSTGMNLLLPLYHLVSDIELPHITPLYSYRNTSQFKDDLAFLVKHFQPISLHDILDHPDPNKGFDRPVFHLTFDDGLREVFEVVWPILKEFGITATLFINPAFLDNKSLFYRHKAALLIDKLPQKSVKHAAVKKLLTAKGSWKGSFAKSVKVLNYNQEAILDELAVILDIDFSAYLQEQKPYCSTQQVLQMIEEGLSIGAHSMDHPRFSDISIPAQIEQTQQSLKAVRDTFGTRYDAFAFPFTDDGVKNNFFESMYQKEIDLSFGTAGLKLDSWPRHLHRVPMEVAGKSAKTIVNTEYLYFSAKQPFNKNEMKRP